MASSPRGGPEGTMLFSSALTTGGAVCNFAVAWSMKSCTATSSSTGNILWFCAGFWPFSDGRVTLCIVTAGYGFSWREKEDVKKMQENKNRHGNREKGWHTFLKSCSASSLTWFMTLCGQASSCRIRSTWLATSWGIRQRGIAHLKLPALCLPLH